MGEIPFKGRTTDEYHIRVPLDKTKSEVDSSPCRLLLHKDGKGILTTKKRGGIGRGRERCSFNGRKTSRVSRYGVNYF
jgi:hypothetical protein